MFLHIYRIQVCPEFRSGFVSLHTDPDPKFIIWTDLDPHHWFESSRKFLPISSLRVDMSAPVKGFPWKRSWLLLMKAWACSSPPNCSTATTTRLLVYFPFLVFHQGCGSGSAFISLLEGKIWRKKEEEKSKEIVTGRDCNFIVQI